MRDYARVSPRFWIGETGRQIRAGGVDSQVVALYLLTSPHSNMIGLYWQPIAYVAHETGIGIEGASMALASLCDAGFCSYDLRTEVVWVHEMARFQIADKLEPRDKQCRGVQNTYDDVPANPFLAAFFDRYSTAFCMTRARAYEGACEPLASKAQAQAQAQEKAQAQAQGSTGPQAAPAAAVVPIRKPRAESPTAATWAAYADAYARRYEVDPVRNATTNAQMAQVVARLGSDEAPHVAAYYVGHNGAFYVRSAHAVGALLKDAEKLRTEWATRRQITSAAATQADKTQTNLDAFAPLLARARAEAQQHEQGAEHAE